MVRTSSVDKYGLKKGTWSKDEDDKLRACILQHGHWNWRKLPQLAGLSRCGKSCRLRWVNYLRPDVKRGNFTEEEDDMIIQMHQEFGNKWSKIATKLPGRTDNDIKNHWHTNLKKQEKKSKTSCEVTTKDQVSEEDRQRLLSIPNKNLESDQRTGVSDNDLFTPTILESFPLSDESCDYPSIWDGVNWVDEEWTLTSMGVIDESSEDFWTRPFV